MITAIQFQGVSGATFDLDTDDVPMLTMDITTDTRRTDTDRPTQHGTFPTKQYLSKMLIHIEGNIFADDTAAYWAKRSQLMQAFMPRPDLGNTVVGTLVAHFDGMEPLISECSLDGKPDMPLQALYPTGTTLLIQLQSDVPFWYSQNLYSIATGTPATAPNGYSFPYSFPYSFGGGNTSSTVIVPNAGNAPADPVVTIIGPCSNPAISKDNFTMQFNGLQLNAGDSVTIDFAERTAMTNTGASAYGLIQDNSHWWRLEPGNSNVKYTAFDVASPSHATIFWRNTYFL